jgi:hypothetical protein
MFRKLLFAGVAAVAFIVPLASPSSAQAHEEWHKYYGHHPRFTVVYQTGPFGYWRVFGVFNSQRLAQESAANLRFRGFPARVVYR